MPSEIQNTDRPGVLQSADQQQGKITPELVREIADKVYAMLLADLKIEQERRRLPYRGLTGVRGGRRC
jgi:hypothetical protein